MADGNFFDQFELVPKQNDFQTNWDKTGTPDGKVDMPNGQRETPSDTLDSLGITLVPKAEAKPEIAPYDWTAAGMKLPPAMKPVTSMITGMNQALANVVGTSSDAMDAIAKQLGMATLQGATGKTNTETVMDLMEKAGIGTDKRKAANQFFAKMGESAANNILGMMGFLAAAPEMAALKGEGAVSGVMKQLGTYFQKNPGVAVGQAISSSIGGNLAEKGAETLGAGPTGQALAGMGGSFLGGSLPLSGIGAALGGAVGGPVGALAGGALPWGVGKIAASALNRGRKLAGMAENAVTSAAANPDTLPPILSSSTPDVGLISKAISGSQAKVNNIIDRLTSRITQGQDPVAATRKLQTVNREAYRQAQKIAADDYWSKVNVKQKMDPTALKTWSQGLFKATVPEARGNLPTDIMAQIKGLPATKTTLERMRAIRSNIFERLQSGAVPTAQGTMPMQPTMRKNLNSIMSKIDEQIDQQLPNDVELKKAQAFTKWIHDRFTRGPAGQFARPAANEGTLPPAQKGANRALSDERFGAQQADIAEQMQMPQLQAAAEDFMRGQIAAAAEANGPAGIAKTMAKPQTKAFLKAFPKLDANLQSSVNRLEKATLAKKEVFDSAFMRIANEQPETVISKVLGSASKVKDAESLMNRLKYDPDAVNAAKDQMIIEIERRANHDPQTVLDILQSPDTRKVVGVVLGDALPRMERIARESVELMQVSNGLPAYMKQAAVRGIGLHLGRMLNTGTIQVPSLIGRLAERTFASLVGNPDVDIMTKAIRSPEWEALLHAKVPQTAAEMARLNKLLRRAIKSAEATSYAVQPMLPKEKDSASQ